MGRLYAPGLAARAFETPSAPVNRLLAPTAAAVPPRTLRRVRRDISADRPDTCRPEKCRPEGRPAVAARPGPAESASWVLSVMRSVPSEARCTVSFEGGVAAGAVT